MRVSVCNFFFLNNQFWYKIPLTLRLGKKREKTNNLAMLFFFSFHQIIFMIIDINHNINEITVFQA